MNSSAPYDTEIDAYRSGRRMLGESSFYVSVKLTTSNPEATASSLDMTDFSASLEEEFSDREMSIEVSTSRVDKILECGDRIDLITEIHELALRVQQLEKDVRTFEQNCEVELDSCSWQQKMLQELHLILGHCACDFSHLELSHLSPMCENDQIAFLYSSLHTEFAYEGCIDFFFQNSLSHCDDILESGKRVREICCSTCGSSEVEEDVCGVQSLKCYSSELDITKSTECLRSRATDLLEQISTQSCSSVGTCISTEELEINLSQYLESCGCG